MIACRRVLLGLLCSRACVWFYLILVLGTGDTLGSAVVDNHCDHQRGCNLGGGDGYTLGDGTLLCIFGSTLGGGAGLWVGGCIGGLGLWSFCASVYYIYCVITPLPVVCVGGGGVAVCLKISLRRSRAWMDNSLRCGGIFPWMVDARFAAADMMAFSRVDVRLVIYLRLKNPP